MHHYTLQLVEIYEYRGEPIRTVEREETYLRRSHAVAAARNMRVSARVRATHTGASYAILLDGTVVYCTD